MEGLTSRDRWWSVLVAIGAGAAGFVLVIGALSVRELRADDRFDLLRWQVDTGANKWLWHAGAPFRESLDDDEVLREYFSLPWDDPARRPLENAVEGAIEGRVDAALRELGLSAWIRLPGSVFPPVNIELAKSPRVLVRSPRDVIRRESASLLRPDMSDGEALAAEGRADVAPGISALVVGTGGVATYPAIISDRRSYSSTVAVSAHEWAHHYLTFYPLGIRYGLSADLRTINETVADIVGDEVGALVLERWGDPTVPYPVMPPDVDPPAAAARVDYFEVLRELRLEVDQLLASGEISAAEARMAEVRDELAEAGVFIRRINQAFFAWFGTYAARPDAVDPLGQHLREIRERSGSLREFVAHVRGVTSRTQVTALLIELGGEP